MKDYQYSSIQYANSRTSEIFNIGVIVFDVDVGDFSIKTIETFKPFEKILNIEDCESFDFALSEINKRNHKPYCIANAETNSIFVEASEWLTDKGSNTKDVANSLFNELVTLQKFIH